MKRIAMLTVATGLLSMAAFAETFSGTVVDVMCKGKDLASHTTKCAVGCAKGGYALVTSDGKFLKFDESGNTKALAALKATSKEKDLKAKVDGTMDGEVLQVTSIAIE